MWIRFYDRIMITDTFSQFISVLLKIMRDSRPLFIILFLLYATMTSLFLVLVENDANYFSKKQDIVTEVFG
jgi:hypothetical protein